MKQLYKLTKLKDTKFKGKHPNGIYINYVFTGTLVRDLKIGESLTMKSPLKWFKTSAVTKIFKNGTFNTMNSKYSLEKFNYENSNQW